MPDYMVRVCGFGFGARQSRCFLCFHLFRCAGGKARALK